MKFSKTISFKLTAFPAKCRYFHNEKVLDKTKDSLLVQAFISLILFTVGTLLLFPAKKEQPFDDETVSSIWFRTR